MNSVVQKISLDIHKTGSQLFMSMLRGDNKRSIIFSLTEGGKPYVITSGCKAVFTAVKPDGNFIYNDCEIDYENNTIVYDVTKQTTAASGVVNCQLKLLGEDEGIITSPTFGIVVGETLYNEEPIVESSEEFAALTAYVAELQQKLANGEFKGEKGDAGVSATHKWEGTKLTVTSASGTSSAELKGAKGDKGDKGDRGYPGIDADDSKLAPAIIGYARGNSVSVKDSANASPKGVSIYGKSTQDGTPTPEAPVDIVSVGDDGSIVVSVNEQTATVSTPNGLRGIPVTDPNLATYTDENGQMWCADEVDLDRGVYVQRVSEYVTPSFYSTGTQNVYFASLDESRNVMNTRVISTHFEWTISGALASTPIGKMIVRDRPDLMGPVVYCASSIAAMDEFNAWIKERNVRFLSILATPIETPLTEDEIEQYRALKMNYPNTTIQNDENAYMDVEYVVDTKLYINSIVGTPPSTISYINLPASKWQDAEEDDLYYQVVSISGVTENSKIDINPSVEQLAIFHKKDIAFVTENEDGVVTVYCIGQKPLLDYSMQITITEVISNG